MRVLVIEKDTDVPLFLKDLLSRSGFEVFTSASGRNGLEVLREHKTVDYIIADSKFADIEGIEFSLQAASIQGKASVTLVCPEELFDVLGSIL